MKTFPTLYKRTATGKTQKWIITAEDDGYYTIEGILDGKMTQNKPHTCEPKNVGKKNASTAEQQAIVEAQAKWEKKVKHGYTEDIKEIDNVTFVKPMKGDKWKDRSKEATFPVFVQDKLNGVRCQNDINRAYSTGGETFYTIPHIREALAPIFEEWPDAFIDGEAFNYKIRKKLNRLIHLVSVVYQPKDLTPELLAESAEIVQFHVFDCFNIGGITENDPWQVRHAMLAREIKRIKPPACVQVLPYNVCLNVEDLMLQLGRNRKIGGEGLMVRWGDCPYKAGRSKYMLKLKHFEDAEFKVVDVQEGNADWKGCAKRIVLELPKPATNATKDTTFAANIDGDREWLRELFQNKEKVIGQPATTEYQQLSEYGIPQIPWVRAIRNYE